jgi:hypothetical protein
MRSFNKILIAGAMALAALSPVAAQRYLTPQFANVTRTDNVAYGRNFTVIALSTTGMMRGDSLRCDVYRPAADPAPTGRPLVIYLHTGNFLPQVFTQSPNGDKQDSLPIEICTRFAKLGYVAASATYRLGWTPTDTSQARRINTLINAAYRGVQDARTAIRYFKANAALYGIDTNRIVVFGQGTGGYISLAAASLDSYTKTVITQFPAGKFLQGSTPMVIERLPNITPPFYVNGDVEGKVLGLTPPNTGPVPPALDTLCQPNHILPSSKFHMQVNLGGALGDLSWLDANTKMPMVSFQVPYDPFAPYGSAVLRVPVDGGVSLPVVEVQGAGSYQPRVDSLGYNNAFDALIPAHDPYRAIFQARTGGTRVRGLFPMIGSAGQPGDSSPWDFWSASSPYNTQGLATNPDMSPAKAKRYVDTIMTVVVPRACIALNLPCKGAVTSTEEILSENAYKVSVSPNPTSATIRFESEATNPIQAVQIYDLSGRLVREIKTVNSAFLQVDRQGLPAGMYVAKLKFEGGIIAKRFVFE